MPFDTDGFNVVSLMCMKHHQQQVKNNEHRGKKCIEYFQTPSTNMNCFTWQISQNSNMSVNYFVCVCGHKELIYERTEKKMEWHFWVRKNSFFISQRSNLNFGIASCSYITFSKYLFPKHGSVYCIKIFQFSQQKIIFTQQPPRKQIYCTHDTQGQNYTLQTGPLPVRVTKSILNLMSSNSGASLCDMQIVSDAGLS